LTDWKFIARKYWRQMLGHPSLPEPLVWRQMKKIHGNTFIDVGANLGLVYSFPLHQNFQRTYAIEPNPSAVSGIRFEIRRRRIVNDAEWGNIEVDEFAASDENGIVDLFLDNTKGRCSGSADTIEPVFLYRPASNPLVDMKSIGVTRDEQYYSPEVWKEQMEKQGKEAVKVTARKLDDWWGEGQIDLMKIDVEGAEFKVLRGAKRILRLVKNLVVELHDRERKRELEITLANYGFNFTWLDPDHIFGTRP
jgi:FkbM family methyltransferase